MKKAICGRDSQPGFESAYSKAEIAELERREQLRIAMSNRPAAEFQHYCCLTPLCCRLRGHRGWCIAKAEAAAMNDPKPFKSCTHIGLPFGFFTRIKWPADDLDSVLNQPPSSAEKAEIYEVEQAHALSIPAYLKVSCKNHFCHRVKDHAGLCIIRDIMAGQLKSGSLRFEIGKPFTVGNHSYVRVKLKSS